jgi:hypothetical protein
MKFYVITLFILLVGCGPSAQEKKANSPECLAAKNEAAERKAKAELVDTEIRAKNDENRCCRRFQESWVYHESVI